MSRRIFLDVEEALAREVRRITFHDSRTQDKVILQDTYDVFTGEVIQAPIEANFYDSSADTQHIQYPHVFIRLMKTKEDRTTGRVVPQYGKWIVSPVTTSPGAYQIIVPGSDALITALGSSLTTTIFQIRKVQVGHLIRLLAGNNKGTYTVSSITINPSGDHTITVSNTLVTNLPALSYNLVNGVVTFLNDIDLNTVKIGDIFTDASSNTFSITAVNPSQASITLAPSLIVNTALGGSVSRSGNVFTATDLSPVKYLVMDPNQPIQTVGVCGPQNASSSYAGVSPEVPIDAYYLIRIDSKTRENHISVLNRVWEEFNPPRTALPVIRRSSLSAEQSLTVDITLGGSNIVEVADTTKFKVNDQVFVFDDFTPTKAVSGDGFQRPFSSKVVNILSATEIELADTVPDTYKVEKSSKIVSNAQFQLFMFHFVDHVTKDVEGAQYWVHEFTFWVQVFVDRLETPADTSAVVGADSSAILDIAIPIENLEGDIIIEDT
jgi:hypothetical protein